MASDAGSGSEWFLDEEQLLGELRRASLAVDHTPSVPGYVGFSEVQRGGQGIVYSATQVSTRRTVAVKVLHPTALSSQSARRRFEREIELAATLRHPGVVRVFDSGSTADGRLFLTMEWVEGETLDQVAIRCNRDSKIIAELMARVADALNHAHQHGVIHRDLKPSNIRLAKEGTPTILDFGLARAPAAEMTEITATGAFLGSLPWSSPEQARGATQRVDVRSDIYAMGVILYQLLAGEFPYDVKADMRTVLNAIAAEPPVPLRRVRPDLHQDLEVIAAKCLAKDPAERYQTAGELAEDLRHHLAGEPIRAQRESMWHAMRRQATRYRTIALAAAAVLVVAAGALIAVVHSANQAARDRDAARLANGRAENTIRFLTSMLEGADPESTADGKDVRVVTLLDQASKNLDRDFADDPASLSAMHSVVGRTYSALGQFEESELHFRAALDLAMNLPEFGPAHPTTLEIEANIADVLLHQSRAAEAEALLRKLIPRMEASVGHASAAVVTARNDLGLCLRYQNRLDEAEAEYRAALGAIPREAPLNETTLALRNNLASLLHSKMKLDEARVLYEQVLADRIAFSGRDHRETMVVLSNLATLHMDQGKYNLAEEPLRKAFEVSVRLRGADHPATLTLEHNLAFAVENVGRTDDALLLWREVVDRRERVLGPDHVHTLVSISNLGSLLGRAGGADEGERYAKLVLERRTQTLGERHIDTVIAHGSLASLYMNTSRPELAEPLVRRAFELSAPEQGIVPANHWLHEAYRSSLGRCLWMRGQRAAGEPMLLEAVAALTARLGTDHPQTKLAQGHLDRLRKQDEGK